jgi:predicted esterase
MVDLVGMGEHSMSRRELGLHRPCGLEEPHPITASSGSTAIMAELTGPKSKGGLTFPQPLVVPPLELPHLQTFIILHGRGSNADSFSRALLKHPIPQHDILGKAFPHAKFVFPTAAFMRAKAFKRIPITQWFDYWPFASTKNQHDPEVDGLKASCDFVHELIQRAIAEVGPSNVVVGGLSQGCAASLISLLLWDGPQLGAYVGMCGWLPFRELMAKAIGQPADAEDDVFEQNPETVTVAENNDTNEGIAWLRAELDTERMSSSWASKPQGVPIFLGHGSLDPKVPVTEGREAYGLLGKMGFNVTWREYESLGHWYSGEMLKDLVNFLREQGPAKS